MIAFGVFGLCWTTGWQFTAGVRASSTLLQWLELGLIWPYMLGCWIHDANNMLGCWAHDVKEKS